MRIVHTSDWHAGRIWKGKNRLDELERVLDHLARFIEREKIELVLVSGDVFDHGAPSAEAERAVFRFFKRIGSRGTKSVVIAGNHDSPTRLEAWSLLAELVNVHAVAKPLAPERGGVIELRGTNGELATVAALPFAGIKHMLNALELTAEETEARQKYADTLGRMIARLSQRFRHETINLFVAHTHLDGAIKSGSERQVHLGAEWAGTKERIPSTAHYVALGHIHKPQPVEAAPAPTFYAGSPMQLDFGEIGEDKSFVFIEAAPGLPARIERIPYEGAIQLRDVSATLDEIERDASQLSSSGWLRVRVSLTERDPDLAGKVRRLLPNAIIIEPSLPEGIAPVAGAPQDDRAISPRELFAEYFRRQHRSEASNEMLEAFERLRLEDDPTEE